MIARIAEDSFTAPHSPAMALILPAMQLYRPGYGGMDDPDEDR
jgi:hypothetical protein